MSDRKRLKDAIKAVIKKEMAGRGVIENFVEPAPKNIRKELKVDPEGDFGFDIPEFDNEVMEGSALMARGMKKMAKMDRFKDFSEAFKKALKGKGMEVDSDGNMIAEGMKKKRKKKGGLVAYGMDGEVMEGCGATASLPYKDLYGEALSARGFNYDKKGERKKGAPRGDKGEALRKFNAIIRKLRDADSSLSLAEARSKAKTMYRSS